MDNPLVSICIVTYNQEKYIYNCVMSALLQAKDVAVEILIGDDSSNDGTTAIIAELAQRYPELIRHFHHKTNLGVGQNYKFLLNIARGKYIANLDGDDYWLPGKLIKQLALIEGNDNIQAVYTNALCCNESGAIVKIFTGKHPTTIDLRYLIEKCNFLPNSSMLYRSEHKVFFMNLAYDLIDYRLHLHIAEHGTLGYINLPFVVYRENSVGSMCADKGEKVRELLWEATSLTLTRLSNKWLSLKTSANFLSRVLLHVVKTQKHALFLHWWQVVTNSIPNNRLFLIIMISWYACRKILLFIANRICVKLCNCMRIINIR